MFSTKNSIVIHCIWAMASIKTSRGYINSGCSQKGRQDYHMHTMAMTTTRATKLVCPSKDPPSLFSSM